MKEMLTVLFLLFSSAVTEPQAPYPPSGWRPSGPSFELPQQNPEYLPPVDPRRPNPPARNPSDEDVTVQGLPTQEQLPLFQLSPVNGQQYTGPAFNSDITNLNKDFQQYQFQKQQERSRQVPSQSQQNLDTRIINPDGNYSPNPQVPSQFVPRTTTFPTEVFIAPKPKITVKATETTTINKPVKTTNTETDFESLNLGEVSNGQVLSKNSDKTSLEVTRENIQEYPPELFLSPLAQLQLQSQYAPLQQLGQIRAPVYFQATSQNSPARQVSSGYDAPIHFSALSSILAERQNVEGPQLVVESQQALLRTPALLVNKPEQPLNILNPSSDQELFIKGQYQPLVQPQAFPQIQPQPIIFNPEPVPQIQPQIGTQPRREDVGDSNQNDNKEQFEFVQQQAFPTQLQPQQPFVPQQVYQPGLGQPQTFNPYQPQNVYQPSIQPQEVYQQYPYQPQPNNFYQPQQPAQGQLVNVPNQDLFLQQQTVAQNPSLFDRQQTPQDALQSGIDINKQGNDIEDQEDKEEPDNEENEDSGATAVATAFGSRTQPRAFPKYGAPIPKVRANPGFQTNSDNSPPQNEDATEAEDSVAETTPTTVSRGYPRKSAKLRSGRVRPVFTLDRSGRLVLARI